MRARLQIGCDSLPRVCAKGEGPSFARLQPKLRSILRENHEQHAQTPRALRKRKLDFEKKNKKMGGWAGPNWSPKQPCLLMRHSAFETIQLNDDYC